MSSYILYGDLKHLRDRKRKQKKRIENPLENAKRCAEYRLRKKERVK
jgi:hypothetical protein